ncbi:hypothetical protein [Xanthocytophaga agilis]|uniref:Lipoprotein n=1 Tax=Xanthocytophaga agilis TaxID=3048010 RepID=A0AAE3UJD5_9BACT|nr:hypothetical protein [Xanthocytophaga agilis]MDJ1505772.1 hypothetical protein [Xanthocytophaga agilis]
MNAKIKIYLKVYLSLLTTALLAGCSQSNADYDLIRQVTQLTGKNLSGYRAVFFVPSQGCDGCINGAENYLLNNYLPRNRKGILFIVTGHKSKKTARIRLGEQALINQDVFVDYVQAFNREPFVSTFPKVIFLDEGNVQAIHEINPRGGEQVYANLDQI